VSDLEAVYDMTWAEFQIRLFAYKRQDKYDWIKLRELMWTTYIAPHQVPKKMVKRKEKFLPLNEKDNSAGVSEQNKAIFIKEFEKYQNAIQKK